MNDDAQLIDETLAGRSVAFGQLVTKYQDRLYNALVHVIGSGEINLAEVRRDVLFVPALLPVPRLLRQFQTSHGHMAIVVDEYGATLGIVTLEDVIEELPTPVRAALVKAEQPLAEQRNLLAVENLNASEKTIFVMLQVDAPIPIDDIVERSGLHSSEVLATLFNLEMKSIVRQWPGKQFSKVML